MGLFKAELGVVDDFRTFNWERMILYPELAYQQSVQFLRNYAHAN